jgi:NADH-quinone oxidoreductase subunit H
VSLFDLGPSNSRPWLIGISVVLLVVAGIWTLLAPAEDTDDVPDQPDEVDPYAGGYPVPPMPGQRLLRTSGSASGDGADSGVPAVAVPAVTDEMSQEVRGG